jgi:hypothetical protein
VVLAKVFGNHYFRRSDYGHILPILPILIINSSYFNYFTHSSYTNYRL